MKRRRRATRVGRLERLDRRPTVVERPTMRRLTLAALFGLLSVVASASARAQGPYPGQPYQVPAGYEAYGPGTLINYGGYDYVIQGDGTMLVAAQPAFTPAPPPAQYVAYDQFQPQVQPVTQWVPPAGANYPAPGYDVGDWSPPHTQTR
jgi:hypothetical protein